MSSSRKKYNMTNKFDQTISVEVINNPFYQQQSIKEYALNDLLNLITSIHDSHDKVSQQAQTRIQSIRRQYQQSRCRLEHQYKYIILLLQQQRDKLSRTLDAELSEFETLYQEIELIMEQFNFNLVQIQQDVLNNKQEILTNLDEDVFAEVLNSLQQQIQESQQQKNDLISKSIQSTQILDQNIEFVKNFVERIFEQTNSIKNFQQNKIQQSQIQQIESRELSNPQLISFDQYQYFSNKRYDNNFCKMDSSTLEDSCESDFLKEFNE